MKLAQQAKTRQSLQHTEREACTADATTRQTPCGEIRPARIDGRNGCARMD
jgi:hypothetical protein